MIIRSPGVRPGKFELADAKRRLQQYRHFSDVSGQADDVGSSGQSGPRNCARPSPEGSETEVNMHMLSSRSSIDLAAD
jgi:hypothetical protein